MLFLRQLADLRMGRLWGFGLVGATGLVLNLAVMSLLLALGSHYLLAAVVATEVSIVSNFLLQERFVFADLRARSKGVVRRATQSLVFNNVEHLVRIPFLVLLVEGGALGEVTAQATTLAIAAVGRFLFVSRVVYRPVPAPAAEASAALEGAA